MLARSYFTFQGLSVSIYLYLRADSLGAGFVGSLSLDLSMRAAPIPQNYFDEFTKKFRDLA